MFSINTAQIDPVAHVYAVDHESPGLKSDFPPTVIPTTTPAAPLASEAVVVAAQIADRESPVASATLSYSLNGIAQGPIAMTSGGSFYTATIPAQPDGTRVDYTVTGTAGAQSTSYSSGYFSGVTPIAMLRVLTPTGEPQYQGYAARIQGVVTAGSGLFGSGTNDDYIQDGSGALNLYRSTNGISVFTATTTGQTVEAVGHIETVGGRFRLDLTESVEKSSSPWHTTVLAAPPIADAPEHVTLADIVADPEHYEGHLVSIVGVNFVSGSIPPSPVSLDAFATVSDGTASFTMKIDHDTNLEGFTPPSGFTMVGIVQQDDFLRPFNSNYDIAPRSRLDLGGPAAPPTPLLTIGEARADHVNNTDGGAGADFVPDLLGQSVKVAR